MIQTRSGVCISLNSLVFQSSDCMFIKSYIMYTLYVYIYMTSFLNEILSTQEIAFSKAADNTESGWSIIKLP